MHDVSDVPARVKSRVNGVAAARWIRAMLLLLLVLAPAGELVADAGRVALMTERPSNRLAWNHLGERAALHHVFGEILGDYIGRTAELELVSAYRTNGVQQAAAAGLYLPAGDSTYEKWRTFLDADIFVEVELDDRRILWRVVSGDREATRKVERPYRQPKAAAAALVRAVFEVAGVAIPEAWEAELEDPETRRPELFIEWAQWIGYKPHWLHHAPWQGPRASAKRIIDRDPHFKRGMAWALPTRLRKPKEATSAPSGVQDFKHAFPVLDSRFAGAVHGFVRKVAQEEGQMGFALRHLELGMLDLEIGMGDGMIEEEAAAGDLAAIEGPGGERGEVDSSPRIRRELIKALAGVDHRLYKLALKSAVEDEPEASVRAEAVRALARYDAGTGLEAARKAWEDPDPQVRAAAVGTLAGWGRLAEAQARAAAGAQAPEVRTRLAAVLGGAEGRRNLEAGEVRELLAGLLGDPEPAVRLEAVRSLAGWEAGGGPEAPGVRRRLATILETGGTGERLAAMRWIRRAGAGAFTGSLEGLLEAEAPRVRAEAAEALVALDPGSRDRAIEALTGTTAAHGQRVLSDLLSASGAPGHRAQLFELVARAREPVREHACNAAYRMIGSDRRDLARVMRYDPVMRVNLGMFRLLEKLGDRSLREELVGWAAGEHPNEHIRARALRELEAMEAPSLTAHCRAALTSPYWVLRLEAADILSRHASSEDLAAIRAAEAEARDEWLRLALEDARHQAEGKPLPERVRLGLGERGHTEGGHHPQGIQIWAQGPPEDREEARRLVDAGYRFGFTTKPVNVPGGTNVRHVNNAAGMRNSYILEGVFEPLEKRAEDLPYTYYIALFDEPMNFGGGAKPTRAFLLEAGRPDLIAELEDISWRQRLDHLPGELRRAWDYHAARQAAGANNWVVHMFRLTAGRKYPDLNIFPQTLTYMQHQSKDALDLIEADGDYAWRYHRHNFFGDGSMGRMNRVLGPDRTLASITWMSWHRPNFSRGNSINVKTTYPEGPWRMRDYVGTLSALALWATGSEAGFFPHIGFEHLDSTGPEGHSTMAVWLHPYSRRAEKAIDYLMNDRGYWRDVEARVSLELEKAKSGGDDVFGDPMAADDGLDNFQLEEGPTPLEKAVQERKQAQYERHMTGISYMNIFNTDNTRALSNLPKPDTRRRDTLVITGRETQWRHDPSHFFIPAIAVAAGFDFAPTYDAAAEAELMAYDTIMLNASRDGVTPELVAGINHWLEHKEGGLLILSGDVSSRKSLFPMVRLEEARTPFLWEAEVTADRPERVEETYKDRRGRQKTRTAWPKLGRVVEADGTAAEDPLTRVEATYTGTEAEALAPLIETRDGRAVLARWNAPESVKSVVLFDGAAEAGPVYTGRLERHVLEIDAARGSAVKRNPYWGHVRYENEQFVVDVASIGFKPLHEARPSRIEGVDIITGEINPQVKHRQAALVLKDYVGPYAGGRGVWAVLARHELKSMEVVSPERLEVHAAGPTRITRIGDRPIRLAETAGFEAAPNQVELWRLMRQEKRGYHLKKIEGGYELHYVSPDPVRVVVE